MLLDAFPALRNNKIIKALRAFYDSWAYLILVSVAMVLAEVYSLELYLYYFYLVLAVGIVLVMDDLRHVIPIVPCCYACISTANNPGAGAKEGVGIFFDPVFRIHLVFLLTTAIFLLFVRLVTFLLYGERRKGVPLLTIGFFALGLSYVLAGIFSPYYSLRTAFFGFVEIASLCLFYFFFYYGVNWKTMPKEYWARAFTAVGFGICFEVFALYCTTDILETGNRGLILTGWGIYNNVGCAIAMCLPAPLYLAATKRNGWFYLLLSVLMAAGLAMTQSRGAILFGTIVYAAAFLATLFVSKGRERIGNLLATLGLAIVAAAVVVVFLARPSVLQRLLDLFGGISSRDFFESSGRWEIYKVGMSQFKEAPFFGVGFYECGAYRWGTYSPDAFLPGRYHDTYVQLLASGGVFSLCCYLLHRLETVFLVCRDFTREKLYCAFCCAALVATAIVDCHFFNFGPGLFYGILLACAEGSAPERPRRRKDSFNAEPQAQA